VLDVLDLTSAREATRQVFLTFKNMQAVLRWAVAQQYLTSNPIKGMEKLLGSTPNERVLTNDEIRKLWIGLPKAVPMSENCSRIIIAPDHRAAAGRSLRHAQGRDRSRT
jgi:hypothetical protein